MAQYHPVVNVEQGSPSVVIPGLDARSELKAGDYFKLQGVTGVYEVASAPSYSGGDTLVTLTAPYAEASEVDAPAIFHRDFSPNQGYPLAYTGDLDLPDILRRWALKNDQDIASILLTLLAKANSADLGTAASENVGPNPLQLPRNLDFGTAAFVDWEQLVAHIDAHIKAKYGLVEV